MKNVRVIQSSFWHVAIVISRQFTTQSIIFLSDKCVEKKIAESFDTRILSKKKEELRIKFVAIHV